MSREIKFRAWDREKGRMFRIARFDFSDNTIYSHLFACDGFLGEDCEIMQYTGLKDKNGVEIFEGDIVKNIRNGISRKVYWDTHCASFHLSKRGREKPGVEYWSLSNPKWNYEVIGNIYENPELLKER